MTHVAAAVVVFLLLLASQAHSSDAPGPAEIRYEPDRGLVFRQGETDLWLGLRFQPRLDTYGGTLVEAEDLLTDQDTTLELRRARIKGGGKVLRDWISVYTEYDVKSSLWLDYRGTVTVGGWLDIRFGQWKHEFTRERVISSGKQSLVDRSISNYWFGIDRHRGLSTSTRIDQGGRWDSRIWVQALTGTGHNASSERGQGLILARWQWNPAGKELAFSQSDIARSPEPISSIALAYVTGDTPCSRFSSSGCGQLPDFEAGDYELEQFLIETAIHHRGIGWEQELHFKKLTDEQTGRVTRMAGGYGQLGFFPNEWWPAAPAQLEIVGRMALVDPDTDEGSDLHQEWVLGANWFFNGHRNKLSFDVTRLDYEEPDLESSKLRFRLQWDVSL